MDSSQQFVQDANYGAVLNRDLEKAPLAHFANFESERVSVSRSASSVSAASDDVRRSVRDKVHGGQATIASEVVNIAKNLIGAGVLSLSGGIAFYADTPSAILSANLFIIALGAIFGYFCFLIAKICNMTNKVTYRDTWQATMGNRGGLAVSLSNALLPALGDLSYAAVLSQTLKSLLLGIGINLSRVACLLIVTVVAIIPLCRLKNLHVLAPFSVLGTAGIVFSAFAMAIRCFDGTYQPGGKFFDDLDPIYRPSFGERNDVWSKAVLPYLCMVYESYLMHYNSPRFFNELRDATLPRYALAVAGAFGLTATVSMAISTFGYLTFGGNADNYILNNYSPNDPLATVCRLAIFVSTLTIYPIAFIGFRDATLDAMAVPVNERTEDKLDKVTAVLLSGLTITAIFVTDLGLINAFAGGTLAAAVVFVFPTFMYRSVVKELGDEAKNEQQEVALTSGLAVFGVILGIVGVWVAIVNS